MDASLRISPEKSESLYKNLLYALPPVKLMPYFSTAPDSITTKDKKPRRPFWAVSASWFLQAVLLQPFLYALGIVLCSKHQNVAPLRSAVSITAVKANSLPSLKV